GIVGRIRLTKPVRTGPTSDACGSLFSNIGGLLSNRRPLSNQHWQLKEAILNEALFCLDFEGRLRRKKMSSTFAPTRFPALVADTYARWTLDCLVEIAYAISIDFVSRPQLYQSDDIPDDIVNLRALYGTDPDFPNTAQRQLMMTPVFGRSDGLKPDATNASAPFQMARKKLVDACIAFSEGAVASVIPMLAERVRSAFIPFTAQLP